MKRILFFLIVCTCAFSCNREKTPTLIDNLDASLRLAVKQSTLMAESLQDKQVLPRTLSSKGELVTSDSKWWTSGFFPGVLWLLYESTPTDSLKMWAERYTALVEDQKYTTSNHDVGFMIFCSFGNGYRLTQNKAYKAVIDTASQSLITRFHPQTGCIRSWDDRRWQYAVIIDNMMNLEMLMWASKTMNNPTYADIAICHANTTMKNHFRPDYSTYHVVSYDTLTGIPDAKQTAQGYSDDSAWARGQSWGLYGYTMMFRETRDSAYLNQAIAIADFLIDHPNMPEDGIPYWDFNAPDIPSALRDASAAAIMCSALIELSDYADGTHAQKFMQMAEKQLTTLTSPDYRSQWGENGNFLIKHGVGNMPSHSEIDVPLTYADYYYLEALLRYKSAMMRSATSSGDK